MGNANLGNGVRADRLSVGFRKELHREEVEALVRGNRLRSLQFVTQAGMLAISGVTAYENTLIDEVPGAAHRLRAVGDIAAAAIASEIAGFLK